LNAPGNGARRFGRADVSLHGPAQFVARPAERWPLRSIELPDRELAEVVATFGIDADADPAEPGPATIEIRLDGDSDLLIALVRQDGYIHAQYADADDAGHAVIQLDIWWGGVDVRVFEFATREAAAQFFQWYAPHEAAMEGPAEPPQAEPPFEVGLEDAGFAPPGVDLQPGDSFGVGGGGEEGGRDADAAEPAEPRSRRPRTRKKARGARRMKARRGDEPEEEEAVPALVPAHAMAEMPSAPGVGTIVTVKFTLSWERVAPEEDAVVDVADVDIDPDSPITISISTHGFRLAKGTRRVREVHLSLDRAKEVREFRLEAVDVGRAEVTIVVRQHHETPLATLRLTPVIVASGVVGDLLPAGAFVTPLDPRVIALPTIRIDESLAGGEATLDVAVQVGAASVTGATKTIDKARLISETYEKIKVLCADLKEMTREERMTDGIEELRSIGVNLARRVFTREVRQFLWDHFDELDHLFIQTTGEFDIPWEIIYLSDPTESVEGKDVEREQFLGMRGATRWVYNTAWVEHVTVGRGRAKYLCPTYRDRSLSLTFTAGEGKFVKGAVKAHVVRPGDAAAMSKIITDGFDLLHFGGHGVWTAAPPDQRLLMAAYTRAGEPPAGSSYSATDLRRDLPDQAMAPDASNAQMVFLNACDIGRLDTSSPGLGGFPEAFLRGGVGVLLGCCWAVDDQVAGRFVRDFYEALLGSDLHDAVGTARRAALDNMDLSGLAYVAYAHPYATVTIA
jgi:CHAT domain